MDPGAPIPFSVIINRTTCRKAWVEWHAWLDREGIPHELFHTHTLGELETTLEQLLGEGRRHFLFVGGDGTMHHGCNTLLRLAGEGVPGLAAGLLPCGTGNDWIRSFGLSREQLADHLRTGTTRALPILRIRWPAGRIRYAINMLGGALDASVVRGLRRAPVRIPSFILYPYGLLKALLKPHTWPARIETDQLTFEGDILTLQAGFGRYCGGGMFVLPHARPDQPGILVMKPKRLLRILLQTPDIYNGRILRHKEAVYGSFDKIEITHTGWPMPLEADGEWLGESPVTVEIAWDALRVY